MSAPSSSVGVVADHPLEGTGVELEDAELVAIALAQQSIASSSSKSSANDDVASDRADAASDDDSDRRSPHTPCVELSFAQSSRATSKLDTLLRRMLYKSMSHDSNIMNDRSLPSKLVRQLRSMAYSKSSTLLQAMHVWSQRDGTTPPPIEHLPTPPPGAPPRKIHKQKQITQEDLEFIEYEVRSDVWRRVAGSLQEEFDDLVAPCSTADARDIAHVDTNLSGCDGVALTYGEVLFPSLCRILALHWGSLEAGRGTFIDIGSGCGKGIFAALCAHDFNKLIGVEILRGLDTAAKQMQKRYETELKSNIDVRQKKRRAMDRQIRTMMNASTHANRDMSTVSPDGVSPATQPVSDSIDVDDSDDCIPNPEIEFLHADFRDLDWSDADVVFVNSTWSHLTHMHIDIAACALATQYNMLLL